MQFKRALDPFSEPLGRLLARFEALLGQLAESQAEGRHESNSQISDVPYRAVRLARYSLRLAAGQRLSAHGCKTHTQARLKTLYMTHDTYFLYILCNVDVYTYL